MEFEIPVQPPVTNEGTAYYEIDDDEDDERKAILSFGKIIGTWENKTRLIAAKILYDDTISELREMAENGGFEDLLRELMADEFYFSGVTDADRIETRRQMLSADKDLLEAWCPALEKMAEEGAVCVVGNDISLRECDNLTVYDL